MLAGGETTHQDAKGSAWVNVHSELRGEIISCPVRGPLYQLFHAVVRGLQRPCLTTQVGCDGAEESWELIGRPQMVDVIFFPQAQLFVANTFLCWPVKVMMQRCGHLMMQRVERLRCGRETAQPPAYTCMANRKTLRAGIV
ncbi:unnamed protein product [Durusdinium trenchii]|uniref:Uncharacterized protein n=2 Tax=Durusdinium trenchii TaxID=1381693 RepID=A0ABP0HJB0_9DINO